jgi:hypothetical protein
MWVDVIVDAIRLVEMKVLGGEPLIQAEIC